MNFIYLIACFLLGYPNMHDIHVSVCDVSVIKEDKLEVTFKIFYDDLQLAMGIEPGSDLPDDYPGADALIEAFLRQSVHFYADEKKLDFRYLDAAASLPAVWVNCEVPFEIGTGTLSIYNAILIDTYSDQTNLVNINMNGKKNSFSLNKKKTRIDLNLSK